MKSTILVISSTHSWDDIRIFHKEIFSLNQAGYNIVLCAQESKIRNSNGKESINLILLKNKSRLKKFIFLPFRLIFIVLQVKPKIVHLHDPDLIVVGLIFKLLKFKVIYDVHEDVPRQILSKYWLPKIFRAFISFLFEKLENFCAKRFDYIITATPFIQERFKKINCYRTIDIKNYPILNSVRIGENHKRERAICYVGGITRERGIFEILRSIEDTDVKLILAGNISPLSLFEELTKEGGWKNVEFLGYVDRNKVTEIYSRTSIGMVVLHPIINYVDALPIKLFEYMYAGIPVIASNFLVIRNIIDKAKCGICVEPGNVSQLKEAIFKLIDNQELMNTMGENGRKAVFENFNWENEGKKLIKVYQKVLKF